MYQLKLFRKKGVGWDTMSEQMQNSEKEYEMLRTEILQYMEEYQTVRNMMYVATVSILGLNGAL